VEKFTTLICSSSVAVLLLTLPGTAIAATVTDTFQSQIVIQADCTIVSTNTLDFGTSGVISANIDATANFSVRCTNTTPYTIGLDVGTTLGGTIAVRKMIGSGTETVDYAMYTDSARTANWDDIGGANTSAGTGTGADQTLTVYGRVPVQTTPAPDTYTDLVTVTVSY